MSVLNLQGKVVLVTGGANGIGREMVKSFLQQEAKVAFFDVDNKKAEELIEEIGTLTNALVYMQTDVSNAEQVETNVKRVVDHFGTIDVLCNNAAVNIPGDAIDLAEELWDKTMDINVKSQFLMLKNVIPIMKQNGGGSVINTASANSYVAEPQLLAYVTSKGAIKMLTQAAALDYAKFNIRVNGICPGWVDTTFNDAHAELFGGREAVLKEVANIQPIGRAIEPVEIANIALFLASDMSSAMTGSMVVADGGITAGA